MEKTVHRSESMGFNDNGWLQTYYTFCFANYYDPRRINFGALRVLNDNTIDGGEGLRSIPHDNMEMVIIPLEGCLEHTDNFGNNTTIAAGEAQIISAGTGIIHREYNHSMTDPVKYLHFWIFPHEYELDPVYSKVTLDEQPENGLLPVVSPQGNAKVLKINQNAWIFLGKLSAGRSLKYELQSEISGMYIMVLEGKLTIADTELKRRDAIGIIDIKECEITADEDSRFILAEIPMTR